MLSEREASVKSNRFFAILTREDKCAARVIGNRTYYKNKVPELLHEEAEKNIARSYPKNFQNY